MNKYVLSLITVAAMVSNMAGVALAQTPTLTTRQEVRQEIKILKETLRGKIVRLGRATITAIGSSNITVVVNNKTYTVNITSTTSLRRHYFGKATLSEFAVNDLVDVVGVYPDDTGAVITARLIRDVSIMKRRGVFFGTVSAKTDTTITLSSRERGTQTISVSQSTKYVNQKNIATTLAAINTGDMIRAAGVWDKANSTISEVTTIKDFSLQ